VLAHTQSSSRNAVQRVHIVGDRAWVLWGSRGRARRRAGVLDTS
jgi:hypothetical protein